MLLEQYMDLGILLLRLMSASRGKEIIFKDKKLTVRGSRGNVTEIDIPFMTISSIERAIEEAED